jgi:preprotein translocase subunit SecF
MGPVYSQSLLSQALRYIPISFILMAIVVFVIFRTPLVSGIVVLCAILDISIAAASMNITGVKLSLGTVAALLMLIGYSVDTNILLTKTALTPRQTLTVDETIVSAMTTGLMMTGTTIAAVLALFIASNLLYLVVPSFTRMDVIADISTVLLFGLFADIFNTWITNAQAIRWYMSRPKKAVVGRRKE